MDVADRRRPSLTRYFLSPEFRKSSGGKCPYFFEITEFPFNTV